MSEELKPCPFCGGKAVLGDLGFEDREYYVVCKKCGAETIISRYPERVIDLWNRRTEAAHEL